VLISAPLTEIKQHFKTTSKILTNTAIVGLIILSIIVLLLAYSIVRPITKTNKVLEKLAIGDVHNIKPLKIKTQDELGDMAKSANTVAKGLNEVTVFAENIGAGNYNYKFNKLSDNDTLGIAVIEMRNSLKKAREDEALRKKEANQLEWASAGMNIFNKVLRIDNKTLETLTYDIIKTLTTYLDAHMGGIYVKTDLNEKEFELISFIGFSKKKYTKKFIKPEDGDVGRCILEKQTIFINDVPSDFSKVISGLGSSVPKAILIVPLISNRNLIGILEIESLNVIEQYKINFVERIAETIASTVETVKVNANTTILLNKAQQQAEELEEQEEEMRQNMEEMQATQEEASKQEMILSSFIDGFKKMLPVIEYSIDGKIIDVNDLYLNIYKVNRSQMLGKMHKSDSFMTESEKSNHKIFWQKLVDGEEQELLEHINVKKNSYWINEKYIPIKDQYGIVQKILCIGFDVTKLKQKEKKILNNKNTDIPKIDLNKKYKTIDLAYFKMIYKKDAVKIYNVLKIYYETLPVQIKNIETLINTRDYDNLKIDINNLKNKISDLGKKPINDKIHNIENILDSKRNLANIPDLVKEFIDLWMEMREEMKIILKI
jgi:methyl-accepting chemotaxis protein